MSTTPLLHGVRVLDLSRILAGPWASQLLADLGADVVKIERPGEGDDTRHWGPPWLRDLEGQQTSESAYFLSANRGKRSLAIDFQHAQGAALIADLAAGAHVLIENFKAGGLARHGLDYAALAPHCPRLVYCSISGFGQTGPHAHRAGYDAAIQAMGGLMSITGVADGQPGAGPQKVGVAVADLMTGMYAVAGILAALRHAEATGEGQHIDLALFDTQVAWLANQAMNHLVGGLVPQRQGGAHPNIAPYQVVAAADGHFMLAVGNDAQFARLCEQLGVAEWASDPRFASNAARVAHRAELIEALESRLRMHDCAHWLRQLEQALVPAAPVNRIDQVFQDPQIAAHELLRDLPHPRAGSVPSVANPLRFSATPIAYRQAPPLLGEHSDQVLRDWLSLSDERIAELRSAAVIA